jgi:hypothetical protein
MDDKVLRANKHIQVSCMLSALWGIRDVDANISDLLDVASPTWFLHHQKAMENAGIKSYNVLALPELLYESEC